MRSVFAYLLEVVIIDKCCNIVISSTLLRYNLIFLNYNVDLNYSHTKCYSALSKTSDRLFLYQLILLFLWGCS